jgi:hypothetical protein
MAIFPTGNLFPGMGGGIRIPGVAMQAKISNFFDRSSVLGALNDMEKRCFIKGSLKIKDKARKSIKKMGMAKPKLKVAVANPGLSLRELYRLPGLRPHTKKAILERVREIKTRPASLPGHPPHTHVPYGHMLGFRRNLWNFYDPMNHSAVVGPSRKGKQLPYLHEFGGSQVLQTWAYVPQYQGNYSPIIWRLGQGQTPRNTGKWAMVGGPRSAVYPERPFMYPAMQWAVSSGTLAKIFQGQFRVSQAGRGVSIGRRGP